MNFEEYFSYDALGLAELVRTNQISESELLEITIELCNRIDPKINAVPIKHFELARKEAKSFKNKGLFRGVPFLLKDLNKKPFNHKSNLGYLFTDCVSSSLYNSISKYGGEVKAKSYLSLE